MVDGEQVEHTAEEREQRTAHEQRTGPGRVAILGPHERDVRWHGVLSVRGDQHRLSGVERDWHPQRAGIGAAPVVVDRALFEPQVTASGIDGLGLLGLSPGLRRFEHGRRDERAQQPLLLLVDGEFGVQVRFEPALDVARLTGGDERLPAPHHDVGLTRHLREFGAVDQRVTGLGVGLDRKTDLGGACEESALADAQQ